MLLPTVCSEPPEAAACAQVFGSARPLSLVKIVEVSASIWYSLVLLALASHGEVAMACGCSGLATWIWKGHVLQLHSCAPLFWRECVGACCFTGFKGVRLCACARVCVRECICEREREGVFVCVCVCVCYLSQLCRFFLRIWLGISH